MKPTTLTVIVSVAAAALCGLGWLLLPALQDSQRAVDAEASIQLERARRLLHQYKYGLAHKSLLLDQLADAGVDVDIEDPQALADAMADEYQQRHATLWEAHQPTDWESDPPTAIRAGYGNLAGQIRDGIGARTDLLDENELLLEGAMDAVQEALSLTIGNASSRSYTEAIRLKGIILYHQALAEWVPALAMRREAAPFRRQLASLAMTVKDCQSMRTLVDDSAIDGQIATLQKGADEARAALAGEREALASRDAAVRDLESRWAAASVRADEARKAMDAILAEGIDFSDPDAAETFGQRLLEQDKAYREAYREAQSLEIGRYQDARIDHTGDYLAGSYVPSDPSTDLAVEHGLNHYRNERDVLAAKLADAERGIDDLRADVERLKGMKVAFEEKQERARRRIPDALSAAGDAFTELNRIEAEAFAGEETALDLFESSAKTSQQAATAAKQWVSDAQQRTRDLTPDAKQRSAHGKRLEDGWMAGFISAHVADAGVAKAWIHYTRYVAHTQSAKILTETSELLALGEADAEAESTKAIEAHDAGVEEITEAMAHLEQAHRDSGQHWTLVAQQAGALYLLGLFGHPSYIDDAIDAYRNVVQGRENEPYVRTYVARLRRLENR